MGCYRGPTATMMKQGSTQAIRFYVMETLKDKYRGGDPTVAVTKLFDCARQIIVDKGLAAFYKGTTPRPAG